MHNCAIIFLTEQGLSGLLVGASVVGLGERSASPLMYFSTICCCDGLFVIVTLTLSVFVPVHVMLLLLLWHSLHNDVEDY